MTTPSSLVTLVYLEYKNIILYLHIIYRSTPNLEMERLIKGIDFNGCCFACCVGALLTGTLWLIARNPWIGVFTTGFCLAIFIIENCGLAEEARKLHENVLDLEKQIVALSSTLRLIGIHRNSSSAIGDLEVHIEEMKQRGKRKSRHNVMSRSLDSLI